MNSGISKKSQKINRKMEEDAFVIEQYFEICSDRMREIENISSMLGEKIKCDEKISIRDYNFLLSWMDLRIFENNLGLDNYLENQGIYQERLFDVEKMVLQSNLKAYKKFLNYLSQELYKFESTLFADYDISFEKTNFKETAEMFNYLDKIVGE